MAQADCQMPAEMALPVGAEEETLVCLVEGLSWGRCWAGKTSYAHKAQLYHCLADGGCNIQTPKHWAQQASQAGCASLRPIGLLTESETVSGEA